MKITQHEGRELRYHRAMVGLEHPHLVRCLTSFTLGAKHHMVGQIQDRPLFYLPHQLTVVSGVPISEQ